MHSTTKQIPSTKKPWYGRVPSYQLPYDHAKPAVYQKHQGAQPPPRTFIQIPSRLRYRYGPQLPPNRSLWPPKEKKTLKQKFSKVSNWVALSNKHRAVFGSHLDDKPKIFPTYAAKVADEMKNLTTLVNPSDLVKDKLFTIANSNLDNYSRSTNTYVHKLWRS